jgi:hypothetical protein
MFEQNAQYRGYEDEMGYTSYTEPSDVFIPSNYMSKVNRLKKLQIYLKSQIS